MIFIDLKYRTWIAQMIYIGIVWDTAAIQIVKKNKVTCPTKNKNKKQKQNKSKNT